MAQRATEICMALVMVSALLAHSSAQTSGCTTALVGLMPCLSYVSGNSSTPSSSCCSQLASVVQSQPQCLCLLLNGAASSLGISINTTLAMALPTACKVQTPPVSLCSVIAGDSPTPSPSTPSTPSVPSNPSTGSPSMPSVPSNPSTEPSTPSTPSVPSVPAAGGSKTSPTNSEYSDGSSNKMTRSLMFNILLIASGVSALTSF